MKPTKEEIEDFRKEYTIPYRNPETPQEWAVKENALLNFMCDLAIASIAALPEVAASADENRYRWARMQTPDRLLDLYMNIPGTATPEQFDAEIDAAIQAGSRMNKDESK